MNLMVLPVAEVIYREFYSESEYRQRMRELAGFGDVAVTTGNSAGQIRDWLSSARLLAGMAVASIGILAIETI